MGEVDRRDDDYDNDYQREHEEMRRKRLKAEVDWEAKLDDNFAKLQLDHQKDKAPPQRKRTEPEMKGGAPGHRTIGEGGWDKGGNKLPN